MSIFEPHLEAIGLQRRLFSTRPPTLASRWLGSLMAGAGLLLLSHGLTELLRVSAMQRWPVAEGQVISLSVERSAQTGKWEPRLRYSFEVQGRRYSNTRLTVKPVTFVHYDEAQHYLHRNWFRYYHLGTAIEVRYNPADPMDSIVELWPHPRFWWVLGAGALLPLLALVLAMRIWQNPVPMWSERPPMFEP